MWKYEGEVDKSGKTLTLEAEGPNFTVPGSMTKFQDIYEFKSENEIIMTSRMLGKDGKWAGQSHVDWFRSNDCIESTFDNPTKFGLWELP
jgi:hypothetical protein